MDHDTVTTFVEDAIEELEQRNALEEAEYLRMMLECDGPDIDGAVTSLIKYGAVTVAWVERLAAINEKICGALRRKNGGAARGTLGRLGSLRARETPDQAMPHAGGQAPRLASRQTGAPETHRKPRASNGSPGWGLWRWGESNPVQWPAPNSSPSAVYGLFLSPSIAQTHRWIGSVD